MHIYTHVCIYVSGLRSCGLYGCMHAHMYTHQHVNIHSGPFAYTSTVIRKSLLAQTCT